MADLSVYTFSQQVPTGNPIKTAVTKTDIATYKGMLAQGNVDGFYQALQGKGFDSAYWARDEFNKATDYGAANSVYWQNQTGKGKNKRLRNY